MYISIDLREYDVHTTLDNIVFLHFFFHFFNMHTIYSHFQYIYYSLHFFVILRESGQVVYLLYYKYNNLEVSYLKKKTSPYPNIILLFVC